VTLKGQRLRSVGVKRHTVRVRQKNLELSAISTLQSTYADYVNPQWVRLLNLLQMNVRYERCVGSELYTSDGRTIVDFLSGYCVHNTGHNHASIIAAVKDELDRRGPAMSQSHVAELAGDLAARLCHHAGGPAQKVFFCSSGSEGVEAAIKFSRAHTRRSRLLYAEGAFHGLTCGNNFLVLKAAPPWVVTEAQIDSLVCAMRSVVELIHSSGTFWSEALGLARRVVHV
jgi:ornithine--oxo-acid transaminase